MLYYYLYFKILSRQGWQHDVADDRFKTINMIIKPYQQEQKSREIEYMIIHLKNLILKFETSMEKHHGIF